jgi:propanol-preferring alcohol dehydrogenase
MCSASTVYRSIIESNLKAGSWVCFPGGGGGVGIQGVQLAKAVGLRPVVVDTGADKRKLALELGAEAFVDFKDSEDPSKSVIEIADGVGVHGVFVTAPAAYKTALSYVGDRVGSMVMCIGLPEKGSMILGTDPCEYIFKNLSIKGTLVGSQRDTAAALDFARRGKPVSEPAKSDSPFANN